MRETAPYRLGVYCDHGKPAKLANDCNGPRHAPINCNTWPALPFEHQEALEIGLMRDANRQTVAKQE